MNKIAIAEDDVSLIPATNVKVKYATKGMYVSQPAGLAGK